MAITKNPPNTVHLGGPITLEATRPAVETITPGMLLEYHDDSGALKWGVHDSADAVVHNAIALNQPQMNRGIDDDYAAGDLVEAGVLQPGSTAYLILASGQNVARAAVLQSNGDGRLKALATGVGRFVALESVNATAGALRIRVEVLG